MEKLLTILLCLLSFSLSYSQENDESMLVMFWNLENFYDYTDQGTGESDKEFSSKGSRYWTRRKFYAKCDAIAKSVLWIGEKYGRMPDIIGLAEVENRGVLNKLLDYTLLRKYDYEIIHYDSKDRRGIDVAVLYRKQIMHPLSVTLKVPEYNSEIMSTRDILHARMRLNSGEIYDFIVNHHPSKYGGDIESENRRTAAMTALRQLCDSLSSERLVVMGDFNDIPTAPPFAIVDGILVNKGVGFHRKNEGTIRYEGKWQLIDMFMVSPSLDEATEMQICRIPFLMTWDSRHTGEKPYRTYSGPRYIGGVSDHCSIILRFSCIN